MFNWIMHQQIWGYKVEEKLYLGVREQKRLNTIGPTRSQSLHRLRYPGSCYDYIASINTSSD
jgi:hypothetical protein